MSDDICALAHQVVGHHGPPMFGTEFGLICADCFHIHRGREVDGPPEELTLPGVASLKAFEARSSKDEPLEGGVSWEWRPFIVPAGKDATGEQLYEQPNPPVHCKHAKPGKSSAKGHAPRRRAQLFDLELLSQHLPPAQREPLLLQVLHGLSYEAIATQLGITVNAVRERLRSARARLQALQVIGA